MRFDPIRTRKVADEFSLKWVLNTDFDKEIPMGNTMVLSLNDIISLILVGYKDAVIPLIPKFILWLEGAIKEKEDFGESQSYHQRSMHWALGIYSWILDDTPVGEVWEKARLFDLASVEEGVYPQQEVRAGRLDDYMAFCLQSASYSEGISEFEKFYGRVDLSSKNMLAPREFAYLQCCARVNGNDVFQRQRDIGCKMLRSNLEKWLSYGQHTRAATWLKIVHWDVESKNSAADVILKAYEDMPYVIRPDFV